MKLSQVIEIWEGLYVKDTGELGFSDLEEAIEEVVGIENDISGCQSIKPKFNTAATISGRVVNTRQSIQDNLQPKLQT